MGKGCPLASPLVLCYRLVVSCWERGVLLPFLLWSFLPDDQLVGKACLLALRFCFVIVFWSTGGKELSSWLVSCVVF